MSFFPTILISVGVLVLEEEDEKGLDLGGFGVYITVVAWIMVCIGALYFLLVSLLPRLSSLVSIDDRTKPEVWALVLCYSASALKI